MKQTGSNVELKIFDMNIPHLFALILNSIFIKHSAQIVAVSILEVYLSSVFLEYADILTENCHVMLPLCAQCSLNVTAEPMKTSEGHLISEMPGLALSTDAQL